MELSRSFVMKVVNARRMPPRNDSGRRLGEQKPGFAVHDGFRQSAGLVSDRQRAEFLRIHLAQAARLETRRHQGKIAAGKNPSRLSVVESDGDADRIRPAAMGFNECLFDMRLAAAVDDDLPAGLDDLIGGGQHEIHAFLVHETGNEAEDRPAGQCQAKLLAHVIRVGALAFPIPRAKPLRQVGAGSGIPAFVDAVQYARQLRSIGATAEQALEPATELRRRDLPGIGLADGGQMGGIDNAAFEKGHFVVKFEAIDMERALRRTDPPQRTLSRTVLDRPDCGWSESSGS